MNINLKQMQIENFKGIKSFALDLDGNNCVIKAENGIGKTTIYDAFLWLLFGKNSEGKTDSGKGRFELRPLDGDNQPIKGLVLAIEAVIEFDGVVHTFKKEHHEKVVKGSLRGYETLCWIDEVPKKVGEYGEYIGELISEDTFKLLTDLTYFNSKMHWKERRAVLLDIAGEIGTPEGFDELIAALNGRTVDEYKKVLAEQKKRMVKERNEINPRIDELQRGLDDYAGSDTSELESKRDAIQAEIAELDTKRNDLFAQEKERQANIEKLNSLKAQKLTREAELNNDTTGIQGLLDKKAKIEKGISGCRQAVADVETAIKAEESAIKNDQAEMQSAMSRLTGIRDEYTQASEAPADDTCYACSQKLPQDKLAENNQKRQDKLAEIAKRGDEIKQDVNNCKASIAEHEAKIKDLNDQLEKANIKLQEGLDYQAVEVKKLDAQIDSNHTTPPQEDITWQSICKDIDLAEVEIGEPVTDQLEAIEADRTAKNNELAEINSSLSKADRMKQDKARIEELEAKEKELAQSIADVDKQLADIEQYNATYSEMIESAVNGKFKHVKFKLFSELLNGGLDDCCDATLDGIAYSDMSTGQRIFVGIDIVNVLSAHYNLSVPLFIDHAESLTLPIEANSQTVELYASRGVKELTCNTVEIAERQVA